MVCGGDSGRVRPKKGASRGAANKYYEQKSGKTLPERLCPCQMPRVIL